MARDYIANGNMILEDNIQGDWFANGLLINEVQLVSIDILVSREYIANGRLIIEDGIQGEWFANGILVDEIIVVETPSVSGTQTRIRIAGAWKEAVVYVKVAGAWKLATMYTKIAGSWKTLN